MSEEGGFIDVESDEVPELGGEATASSNSNDPMFHTDKRAHHNLLERRRRDHIKDSFHGLRDCIPSLQGEKVSRAHILNKATEYIRQMQRGGSMRETEITDLKKKNEVLEEQVRVIEQNKAVGSEQKIEDVLESVARQVQVRQRQRDTQGDKATPSTSRAEKPTIDLSGRDLSRSFSMATRTTPTTVGSGADPKKDTGAQTTHSSTTSSALNLLHLAGNLKNAQALLTAFQKNLPQNATLANVKSIASKVLSTHPTNRPASQANGAIPRGIVTATTVPKGSALPPSLASALQQKTPGTTTTTPILVGGKISQLANHLTSQLKPTTSSSSLSTSRPASFTPDMRQDGDDATSNKSTAAQVLEASTLLQQQGGGELGGVSGVIPSITAELIAQCFLNLPNSINNSSSSLGSEPGIDDDESQADGDDVESVAMANDAAVSAANILAALGETLSEGESPANHLPDSPLSALNTSPPPSSSSSITPSLPPATTSLATPTTNDIVSEGAPGLDDDSSETTHETPPVAKKQRLDEQL